MISPAADAGLRTPQGSQYHLRVGRGRRPPAYPNSAEDRSRARPEEENQAAEEEGETLKRFRDFIFRLNGFRLSLLIAFAFLLAHIALEARHGVNNGGFFSDSGFFYRMEYFALDAKMQARGSIPFDPESGRRQGRRKEHRPLRIASVEPHSRRRAGRCDDARRRQGHRLRYYLLRHRQEFDLPRAENASRTSTTRPGLYRPVQPATLGVAADKVKEAYDKLGALEKKSPQLQPARRRAQTK